MNIANKKEMAESWYKCEDPTELTETLVMALIRSNDLPFSMNHALIMIIRFGYNEIVRCIEGEEDELKAMVSFGMIKEGDELYYADYIYYLTVLWQSTLHQKIRYTLMDIADDLETA